MRLVLLLGSDLSKQRTPGAPKGVSGTPAASTSKTPQQKHPPQVPSCTPKPSSRGPRPPASPYTRPRRCRCRPAGRARSPAAGSASGCPPQAAAGPPSSLRACPAGSARGARLPLTRARGAASQHGASDRSSACTRDKPRRVGAAGDDPERPSPLPSAAAAGGREEADQEESPAPRGPVLTAALPLRGRPPTARPGLAVRWARGRLGT